MLFRIPQSQERKRHININKFFWRLPGRGGGSPDRVGGGAFRPVARGSKVYVLCVRNPRNINVFIRVPGREESGSRPGGSVTGVTEKLFMCQMFMCLFRPLSWPGVSTEKTRKCLNIPGCSPLQGKSRFFGALRQQMHLWKHFLPPLCGGGPPLKSVHYCRIVQRDTKPVSQTEKEHQD